MIKRIISILLSVCMVFTLIPTTAFAATDYNIWVGGTRVTSDNASGVTGTGISGTVTYDAGTNTLTLDNATITDFYTDSFSNGAGIYATNSIIIVLKGSNTINISPTIRAIGVFSLNGGVDLSGDGSLTINLGTSSQYSTGIYANNFNSATSIIGCTLTTNGGTTTGASNADSMGIITFGPLLIKDATVIANGGSAPLANSYGILAMNPLTITNSTVIATGDTRAVYRVGTISAEGSVVTASMDKTGTGASPVIIEDATSSSNTYKYVNITPGTSSVGPVTLLVSSATAIDDAARAEGATYKTIGGAITKAESGDTIKLTTDIISASGVSIADKNLILDLDGHSLTGASGVSAIELTGTASLEVKDTSTGATGVLSGSIQAIKNNGTGSVTVSSGTVTSDVNTINNLSTGSVTVSGGAVSTTSESSNAITNSSSGGVTISGGTVTSNGYTISNSNIGNVTVSGGTVSGTAYTIWNNNSQGTINVSNGTVSSSGNVAIMSTGGVVNVSGGTISSSLSPMLSISSTGTLNISGGTLQVVSLPVVNISGNPTLTVRLNPLTSKKVSITGELTGVDGSITLDGTLLINTEAGTAVATATDANYANASKFVLTNVTGKTLAKSSADIVFAADSPSGPPTDWNGIIPTSDPGFAYSGGSGTEASPYLIANSYDLAMLASNVNTTTGYSIGKYFKMTADIDLNPGIAVIDATTIANEWMPIGKYLMEFKGVFDGGGFAIKGMYLKDIAGLQYYGLFGKITNATIKNLGVTNSFVNIIINSSANAAGIIGYALYSTVESCYNTANVNGYNSVGGVVGASVITTVKNCYNTGDISVTRNYAGGIVGQAASTIVQDCYNTGNISGNMIVGGIVGSNISDNVSIPTAMYRCYNTGNVVAAFSESTSSRHFGSSGIVGSFHSPTAAQLDSCVSLGLSVSATTTVGPNMTTRVAKGNGVIKNSYARSDMKVNGNTVLSFSTTSEQGRDLVVAQNTAQDWSIWFGSEGSSAWDYPADGKLWYQAPLPTLKGVGGIQNPTLPGTGSGVTETYTVTYIGNGATSGSVTAQTTNVGTATTVAANGFTKTGYTFAGWNTAANGSGTAYGAGGTVPSQAAGTTITLFAQWNESTYSVSGSVNNNNNSPASGASVKLMKGNTQIGTQGVTTDLNGDFTVTGVPNGSFNLVVSKDGITVTTIVVINNSNNTLSSVIILPSGKTNSVVEVTGSDTPQIVVGNLDGQFSTPAADNDKGITFDDMAIVTSGGSVEIKLIAEKKDDTAANATTISALATSSGKTVGIFMDLSVLKTVKDSGGAEITSQSAILTELSSLIDVLIPLPAALQGKSNYAVYRYHGSAVDSITTTANSDGEKIELVDNNTTLKLTIKKFSTYAIAYTTPSSHSGGGSSGGGSSSSISSSAITAEQSEGGKITINTGEKTATITPDDGYVIADVIVDGKSIGATGKYTVADSKAHTLSVVFVKKTALPYYIKNGGNVYIGFSAIAGKVYIYMAPTGENVAFRENPKNFTDNTIAWAKPSIDFVTERELFLGASQDMFSPNENMTRAMFVAVIGRLYERSYESVAGKSTFIDVNTNAYYAKYVAWANENGIIKGIGENKFAPDEHVTREQMAVIMLNFADFLNKADVADSSLAYGDSTSISSWAIDGAKYCQSTKVITGRNGGNFAPQESATRAEVAAVIERFIKTIMQ